MGNILFKSRSNRPIKKPPPITIPEKDDEIITYSKHEFMRIFMSVPPNKL